MNCREEDGYIVIDAVPVFDEHGDYDADKLQEIAANCNQRIADTGDETPLCIGHTLDDAPEAHQPEIVGFARDFRVGTVGKLKPRKAILATFRFRKDKWQKAKNYPRRSVELWKDALYFDPIALLSSTSPARDLGLMCCYSKGGRCVYRYSADYDEKKHPRKNDGKFAPKGHGEQPKQKTDKPTDTSKPSQGVKAKAKALAVSGGKHLLHIPVDAVKSVGEFGHSVSEGYRQAGFSGAALAGVQHTAKKVWAKTYQKWEQRYGRTAALLMFGGYVGSWGLYAVDPVLTMKLLPEAATEIMVAAETIRTVFKTGKALVDKIRHDKTEALDLATMLKLIRELSDTIAHETGHKPRELSDEQILRGLKRFGALQEKNAKRTAKYQQPTKGLPMEDTESIINQVMQALENSDVFQWVREQMSQPHDEKQPYSEQDSLQEKEPDTLEGHEPPMPQDKMDDHDDKERFEEPEPEPKPEPKPEDRERLKAQRDQYRHFVEKFKRENEAMKFQLDEVQRRLRRADRERDLIRLEAEGVMFDVGEELETVQDMMPERYAKHLETMRKRYQRSPVGVNLQPVRIADHGGKPEFDRDAMERAVNLATNGSMNYHQAIDAVKNHRI